MDWTAEQRLIIANVAEFARKKIGPIAAEIDKTGEFPKDTIRQMSELGLMGLVISDRYRGTFLGYPLYYECIQEIAKHCPSHAITLISHCICAELISEYGTDELKERYLPLLSTGELLGACAMTEPETGSDLSSVQTFAEECNGRYVLNGNKSFITNGRQAGIIVVLACISHESTPFNTALFLVETNAKGFRKGRKEEKMGFRAADTSEFFLENVEVPSSHLIGSKGKGVMHISRIMETSRIAVASMALGIAKTAFSHAYRYSKQRKQFGKQIFGHEGIKFKLSDMAVDIESAQSLIEHVSSMQQNGKTITKQASMTKLFCTDRANEVVSKTMQIFSAYGYIKDFSIERHYRDVFLCKIIEGTNDIHRLIISEHLK